MPRKIHRVRLTGVCTLAVLSCLPLSPRSGSAQSTLGAVDRYVRGQLVRQHIPGGHARRGIVLRLALTFTTDATGLTVTAPSSGKIAPPGYHMVFIVNGTDVPSVAKVVKIY